MNNQKNDFDDAIIKEGLQKEIIKVSGDKITYPNGKEYNFKDPEEKVRAKVFIELVVKYKYALKRLDTEVLGPRREPKLPADIVVYEDDDLEKAFIVVETKAIATNKEIDTAKREGLGNANLLNAKFLLVVCDQEKFSFDVNKKPALKKLDNSIIADVPVAYGRVPEYKYKKGDDKWDLRKVGYGELSNKFQLCHDDIWEGGKRDPATAFDEISKVLLSKIYDERFTSNEGYYKFQIGTNETISDVAKRIRELYKFVQDKEPEVFRGRIEIPDYVIFRLVEILQDVSLIKTDLDAKGRAFEHFLGRLFRGEYGQYFTPRQVVEFMVSMSEPTEKDTVLDPACGSGGFLLYTWMYIKEKIKQSYKGDTETIRWIDFSFSHKQLYGVEINDRIARVAMMDMAIHEDGHSNIDCNDALLDYKEFDPKKEIKKERFDLILTNPPFGAVVKNEDILKSYNLGKNRKTQRTEILFLERCLDLLKSGGKLGIVIPNSILSNPSESYVRQFIKDHYDILAIIGTPFETFRSAGANVRSSLLFLRKKDTKIKSNNSIFFAKANYVGFDNSGREIKENDFPEILRAFQDSSTKTGKFVSINPYIFNYAKAKLDDNLTADYYVQKLLDVAGEGLFDELGKLVMYRQEKFQPKESPGKVFKIVSVHFDGNISVREEKQGSDFKYNYQYIMHSGDIVLSRIDCSHGAVAVVPEELDGAVCSGEFYVLVPGKDVNSMVLWHLLRSKQVSEQMIGLSSGMTGRHRLGRDQLLKIKIPKIDANVVKLFISKITKSIDLLKQANDLKRESLSLLEKSLDKS